MKALSIRQPWAYAIVHLGKRIENRSRADGRMPALCRYRGPLLIHASANVVGASFDEECEAFGATMTGIDFSAWRAFRDVYLYAVRADGRHRWRARMALLRGGLIGRCNVVAHVEPTGATREDPHDPESGAPNVGPLDFRWSVPGSYGIILADVEPLPFIRWKGALGLFDVPEEAVQRMLAARALGENGVATP